jgi:6-phosphofructokinase 1
MTEQMDRIGVFVAGGPAAGINGVIKGIVQEAGNAGIKVNGYLDGARGLVEGEFVELTRRMVENIHFLGGSIIGTSRHRIDPEKGDVARIVENLRREGIDGLVSIGGEGTLALADSLRQAGFRIVHVPKTIDNDIAGLDQSFGFDTAVHEAARMLTAVKLDAEASDLWFVVEIMGRYTGHLALEAGLASGCTRVLIPEDGPIDMAELVNLVRSRSECGQHWGVILVAESANFGEGYITRGGRLGGVADELAARLEGACGLGEVPVKIRTSNLGYFLRCAEPTAFDRSYALKLGLGGARFILDPACSGQMVTIQGDHFVGVPMGEVAGKVKLVDRTGIRYAALHAIQNYESARLSSQEQRAAMAQAPQALRWLDCHASLETVENLAMRLGVPAESVVAVLAELARLEAGGEQIAQAVAACSITPPEP